MILSLENYGVIGSGVYEFTTGLCSVVGQNGTGKSTIAGALFLALTGETLDGHNLVDKISWGTSQAVVKLSTKDFVITRTISEQGVKHLLEMDGVMSKKKAEIQEFVLRYYDLKSIKNLEEVYFTAQYKAIDVVNTTASNRISLLSSVFGLGRFERIRSIIQDILSGITLYSTPEEVKTNLQATIDQSKAKAEGYGESICEVQYILNDTPEVSQEEYTIALSCANVDKGDIPDYEEAIEFNTKEIERVEEILKERREVLDSLKYQSSLATQHKDYLISKESLTNCTKEYEEFDKDFLSSKDIQKYLETLYVTRATQETEKKVLLDKSTMLAEGVCPLTKTTPCSALMAEYNPANIKASLDDLERRLDCTQKEVEDVKESVEISKQLESKLQSLVLTKQHLESVCNNTNDTVKNFDLGSYDETLDVVELTLEVEETERVLTQLKLALANKERLLKDLKNAKYSGEESTSLINSYKTYNDAKNELSKLRTLYNDIKESLAVSQSMMTTILEQEEETLKKKRKCDALQNVRTLCHRDNIPRLLLIDTINSINVSLASYVDKFEFKYPLRLSIDGSFLYYNMATGWQDVNKLSGGQQYIVAIILKLCLIEELKTSFPFIILDEPTTGMDDVNRGILAALLQNIADKLSKNDLSLIIPTHDRDIMDVSHSYIEL